jgi:thioredoxin-related protein
MNRKILSSLFIAFLAGAVAIYLISQMQDDVIENEPEWISLNQALEKASDENKLVFIDVYEPDCQWCRKLKREVYPSDRVRSVLDRSYYPVKIDGSSDNRVRYKGKFITQVEFSAMIGVTAYPYLVVMDPDGEVIATRQGYLEIGALSRFLRNAAEEKG